MSEVNASFFRDTEREKNRGAGEGGGEDRKKYTPKILFFYHSEAFFRIFARWLFLLYRLCTVYTDDWPVFFYGSAIEEVNKCPDNGENIFLPARATQ